MGRTLKVLEYFHCLGIMSAGSTAIDNSYLEALAESYKNATSWDTRRQVLSIMTGVARFQEVLQYIPGLTQYPYTSANLHRQQYGRAAPVPKKDAPRLRIHNSWIISFFTLQVHTWCRTSHLEKQI